MSIKSFARFLREHAESESLRVSTRFPTALPDKKGKYKAGYEDPMSHKLNVNYDAMKSPANRGHFEKTVDVMRERADIPKHLLTGSHDEVAEHLINHFKNNLLHIHDSLPEATRNRARKWYDGAHKLTSEQAHRYNMPHQSVAGVYAALSPQKDWHENVALGDRMLDIYHNKQHHEWSPEMETTAKRIYGKQDHDIEIHNQIRGKKLSDLHDPIHKASWIRAYDEAHNDRAHYEITPEGDRSSKIANMGVNGPMTRWADHRQAAAKAVKMIESKGDLKTISASLGMNHKVRSFYNNIITPNSSHGDVTIDTHAVAAAHLRPFGGSAEEVHHNFGTSPDKAKQSTKWKPIGNGPNTTGVNGSYALYHEAYRRAAEEKGIKPREMQSVTWEGVRGLFPREMKMAAQAKGKGAKKTAAKTGAEPAKTDTVIDKIHNTWQDHHEGKINADTARSQIYAHAKEAGGHKDIKWG
jgi:hypothetical protein